jgi:hypothetical protein
MKKAILICGLVRDPFRFSLFLEAYEKMSDAKKIPVYYSTWAKEVDKYPKVKELLKRNNVILLEQDEINLILPGHALHQIVTLDFGLSLIDESAFVLKTRPDFLSIEDYLQFLEINPEKPEKCDWTYPNQKTKYYIKCFCPSQPLYINDITFAGNCQDLKKLLLCSLLAICKYNRLAPEQIIWGGSLLSEVPVFDWFFKSNIGLIFSNNQLNIQHREILVESEIYAAVLAYYFLLLQNAFSPTAKYEMTSEECLHDLTLEEIFWSPQANRFMFQYNHSALVNSFTITNLADFILHDLLRPSEFCTKVKKYLKCFSTNPQQKIHQYFDIKKVMKEFGEKNEKIGLAGSKAPFQTTDSFKIRGSIPEWKIKEQSSRGIDEFESEINMLRRTIDKLNLKIAL